MDDIIISMVQNSYQHREKSDELVNNIWIALKESVFWANTERYMYLFNEIIISDALRESCVCVWI